MNETHDPTWDAHVLTHVPQGLSHDEQVEYVAEHADELVWPDCCGAVSPLRAPEVFE